MNSDDLMRSLTEAYNSIYESEETERRKDELYAKDPSLERRFPNAMAEKPMQRVMDYSPQEHSMKALQKSANDPKKGKALKADLNNLAKAQERGSTLPPSTSKPDRDARQQLLGALYDKLKGSADPKDAELLLGKQYIYHDMPEHADEGPEEGLRLLQAYPEFAQILQADGYGEADYRNASRKSGSVQNPFSDRDNEVLDNLRAHLKNLRGRYAKENEETWSKNREQYKDEQSDEDILNQFLDSTSDEVYDEFMKSINDDPSQYYFQPNQDDGNGKKVSIYDLLTSGRFDEFKNATEGDAKELLSDFMDDIGYDQHHQMQMNAFLDHEVDIEPEKLIAAMQKFGPELSPNMRRDIVKDMMKQNPEAYDEHFWKFAGNEDMNREELQDKIIGKLMDRLKSQFKPKNEEYIIQALGEAYNQMYSGQ